MSSVPDILGPLQAFTVRLDLERAPSSKVAGVSAEQLYTTQLYSIGEAAAQLGVSTHTLRYYEREGLLPVPRTPGGQRSYRQGDLDLLRFLLCLRATGMGIQGLREYMALARAGRETRPQRRDLLARHEAAVAAQLAETQAHLQAVRRKIALYDTLAAPLQEPTATPLWDDSPDDALCLAAEQAGLPDQTTPTQPSPSQGEPRA